MRNGKHVKKKEHKVYTSALGLLTVFLLGSAFTSPLGSSQSSTTSHNDVMTRKVAKRTLRQSFKMESKAAEPHRQDQKDDSNVKVAAPKTETKTGNQETSNSNKSDDSSDSSGYLSKISSISPSKVKAAANDKTEAAQLIQSQTGMNQSQSQRAAQELFIDDKYSELREDLSNNNWLGAYQQYQKLSNDGSLKELQASLSN